MHTKQIARIAMLVAVAFVLSYIESVLPLNLGVPGVKAGFSNIVVVLCLYESSMKETIGISFVRILSIVRVLLSGVLFGNYFSIAYSLAGGLLSLIVMVLLKRSVRFSTCGVSVAGGVSHNIGQIIVAMIVLQTEKIIYYLPVLLVSGVIAGVVIGLIASMLVKRLHPIFSE